MAREITTVNVPPAQENEAIHAYQCFGWNLLSNQEVYIKDSHLEKGMLDNTIYSVTETTHYVKLTFERDPSALTNIQKLRELENTYHAIPKPAKKPREVPKALFILVALLGTLLFLVSILTKERLLFIIPTAVIAVPTLLWHRAYQMKMPGWEAACREYRAKCNVVLTEAEQYV